jgi:hypothetical protein
MFKTAKEFIDQLPDVSFSNYYEINQCLNALGLCDWDQIVLRGNEISISPSESQSEHSIPD